MLKIHLFFATTNPLPSGQFFAICGILGLVFLIDILCIMLLSLTLGLWIIMAALALITCGGFFLSYALLQARFNAVINSTTLGLFDEDAFSRYFCTLFASVFFIMPGVISTFLGIALVLPFSSIKTGGKFAKFIGISWQNTYEHLRLK